MCQNFGLILTASFFHVHCAGAAWGAQGSLWRTDRCKTNFPRPEALPLAFAVECMRCKDNSNCEPLPCLLCRRGLGRAGLAVADGPIKKLFLRPEASPLAFAVGSIRIRDHSNCEILPCSLSGRGLGRAGLAVADRPIRTLFLRPEALPLAFAVGSIRNRDHSNCELLPCLLKQRNTSPNTGARAKQYSTSN